MAEALLKTAEVAIRLGFSDTTVRKLAAEGRIPAVRFGEHGHLRFLPEDVDALIDRRRKKDEHALVMAQ